MEDKKAPNGGQERAEWRTAIVPPSVYSHQCNTSARGKRQSVASDNGAGTRKRNPRRCSKVFTLNVHEAYKRTPQDLESFFLTS